MKIAYIVCTYPPYRGGMGNSAKQIAELAVANHQVTVFTPNYDDRQKDLDSTAAVRVEYLNTLFKFGNAAWVPQLIWYLRKYDLTYLHYPFYGAHKQAYNFSLLYRRPLVVHYHMDTAEVGFKALPFWLSRKIVLPLVLFFAKKIVISSLDYLKSSNIKNYYIKHPEKFVEIPFWVDTDFYQPAIKNNNDRELSLLFVGGLDSAHYFKGLEVLLKSVKLIIESEAFLVRLNIVGDGNLKKKYMELVVQMGISNVVNFSGKLNDIGLLNAYQSSDIFILPSINKSEAFGLVLLEAMACGVPVIASNLPGVRSVFINEESGMSFEVGDSEDLMIKIKKLALDEKLRIKMGMAARERVLVSYDKKIVSEKFEKLYEDCSSK
ncbi:MAG: glycosyltransferase family 4 protein [bacterium]